MRLAAGITRHCSWQQTRPRRVCLALLCGSGLALQFKENVFYGENQHRQKIGKTFSHSLHAEINTLFKCLKKNNTYDLKKHSSMASGIMYVVRLMKNTTGKCDMFEYLLGISKPCIRCQSFMYRHMVKKIKYTDIIDNVNVLCEMIRIS